LAYLIVLCETSRSLFKNYLEVNVKFIAKLKTETQCYLN